MTRQFVSVCHIRAVNIIKRCSPLHNVAVSHGKIPRCRPTQC